MLSGNKGDWSEIYALFKILSEKKLVAGDENLNRIEELFFPIIKIIRNESGKNFEYQLDGDLVLIIGGIEVIKMPIKEFSIQADILLTKIKKEKGVFSVPETELFMNSIHCNSIKATSYKKADILIVIHVENINQTAELGFSIKSQLGGDSTLLNASMSTNFTFKILNFNPPLNKLNEINSIKTNSKIKDRISEILKYGGILEFNNIDNSIFRNNLVLIDSLLPIILSEFLIIYNNLNINTIVEITNKIKENNPLKYEYTNEHKFYEYKTKKFLTEVALGMIPSKVWDGIYIASGGYIVVKKDGEVVCYHLYNRNQFEDYLYKNTKFETASSSKHKFGTIYKKNNDYYFKLNLQIRFI